MSQPQPSNPIPATEASFPSQRTGRGAFKALVKCLTDNYFDVSFDYNKPNAELASEFVQVFDVKSPRDFQKAPRCRNIVIVGAGASFATFGGAKFPLAKKAIGRLKKQLGVLGLMDALRYPDVGDAPREDRLSEEEERLRLLTRVESPRQDFESQLAIYSKFYTPRQVRTAIQKMYGHRHFPHFLFESIAHLLKHRFVDAVISYNFDELLDQAIEEELGGSDYRLIISDGDIDELSQFVVDEQLKVPLYIKPHGTASHKSSLRFTKDDYVGIPRDLQAFTRKILHGDTRENPQEQRERFHVNLICVGFAFSSIELLHSLGDHPGLSVFHINHEHSKGDIERQLKDLHCSNAKHYYLGVLSPKERKKQNRIAEKQARRVEGKTWRSLESLFVELTGALPRKFRDPYKPRSLTRHHLLHMLFFRQRGPENPPPAGEEANWPFGAGERIPCEDKHYYYARLCLEIAISLAKGNGRIDLTAAIRGRVGTYYELWRGCDTGNGRPLRDVCTTEFDLDEKYGFSRTIYSLRLNAPASSENESMAHRAAKAIVHKLVAALLSVPDKPFKEHIEGLRPRGTDPVPLLEHFVQLAGSDADDISPRFDLNRLVLMTEPRNGIKQSEARRNVLHTSLSLTSRFHELVHADHWHLLLAISEQGKMLTKLSEALRVPVPGAAGSSEIEHPRIRKRISLIVAADPTNEDMKRRLQKHRQDLLPDEPYELPFWAHNNHMVLTMRMEAEPGLREPFERWTPIRAIAYQKPALSTKVNPILVEQPEDLQRLVSMYFGYVAKAMHHMKIKHDLAKADVCKADVDELRKELLGKWWDIMANENGFIAPARE